MIIQNKEEKQKESQEPFTARRLLNKIKKREFGASNGDVVEIMKEYAAYHMAEQKKAIIKKLGNNSVVISVDVESYINGAYSVDNLK